MIRNSKRNDLGAAGEGAWAAPAQGTPSKTQAPRRSSRGRRATLIVVMLAAVLANWAGWRFLRQRDTSEAVGQGHIGNSAATVASALPALNVTNNVLLISIDTCRADRLSCYGYRRATTPNIDAVARDGAMFKMAMTPVPLTTAAHSSMFTGTYPPTHGVRLNTYDRLADSNVTLAKTLQAAGYRTAAFVAAFPLDARFGLNRGFDTYDGRFSEEGKKGFFSRRAGEQVSRPALAWLEEHAKQPFFLFLHFYDAHHPYQPHAPYTAAFADDVYGGEIAYVDHYIGQVLNRLNALGVYDNTLVIITGDHGEGLGEHGEESHGLFIYQSTLHVPLVMRGPHCVKGIRVDDPVSLVDIMPTVLDFAGLQIPARVEGLSLRTALEGGTAPDRQRAIYGESLEAGTFACSPLAGIIEGSWKYILAPRPEMYELSQDPGESTNLVGRQPEVARRLRGRLETMVKELEMAASRLSPSSVDLETVKRLESLGYVSGGAPSSACAGDASREDPKDFLPTYQRLLRLLHATAQADDARNNEEAKQELLEIVASRPGLILPHLLLAGIALDERRPADAAQQYAKIVDMRDALKDPAKQRYGAREDLARAYFGLGLAAEQAGNPAEAIGHYEQALRLSPHYADAHLNVGADLQKTGRLPEAVGHFQQALRIVPDFADAHYNLAAALALQGNVAQAAAHYADAIRLKADYPGALNNLAWIRATSEDSRLRNAADAVHLAQRACQLTGGREVAAIDTLAAAYAEAGEFTEAVQAARQAMELATQQNNPTLVEAIQGRLRLYQAGSPFREPPAAPVKTSP